MTPFEELEQQANEITANNIRDLHRHFDKAVAHYREERRELARPRVESSEMFAADNHRRKCEDCQAGRKCLVGAWLGISVLTSAMV